MINLEFPLKIEEVYKKISELSLGSGDKYLNVFLSVIYKIFTTDEIKLNEGKLELFHVTRDGKELTIDKDGYFTYKREDKSSKMRVELDDDIVTNYQCSSCKPFSMNIDGVMENPVQMGIMEATNERNKTRKLINKYICFDDTDKN